MNPVNQEAVPVWVADYVLGSYGSGAIMAVPGHDTRDYDFAQQFKLPVVPVVQNPADQNNEQLPFTGWYTCMLPGWYTCMLPGNFFVTVPSVLLSNGKICYVFHAISWIAAC